MYQRPKSGFSHSPKSMRASQRGYEQRRQTTETAPRLSDSDKGRVPVIAISGAAITDGRNTSDVARGLGAQATLIKPFRTGQLAALIDIALAADLSIDR